MTTATATPAPASRTIRLGDEDVVVERPSGRKAGRALALVRSTSGLARELVHEWGRFEQEYADSHTIDLTRAEARRRFPPEPLVDVDGETGAQRPVYYPEGHPLAGELVMVDPLGHMTEEDWTASDNIYRLRQRPSRPETIAALMEFALERAEQTVYRLLALFSMSNADVTAVWRTGGDKFTEALDERADWLLDACYADELVELAVVAGEVIDSGFRRKLEAIGKERLGNALRLLGIDLSPRSPAPTSSPAQTVEGEPQTTSSSPDGDSSSTSTPSNGSHSPTDGPSTPPSTPPTTSSSSSPDDSPTARPSSEPELTATTPATPAPPAAAASSPEPPTSPATRPASE